MLMGNVHAKEVWVEDWGLLTLERAEILNVREIFT